MGPTQTTDRLPQHSFAAGVSFGVPALTEIVAIF
jgi:hypothetical protein